MEIKLIKNEKEVEKVVDLFMNVFSEEPYNEKWTRERALEYLIQEYKKGKNSCFYIEEGEKIIGMTFSYKELWDDGYHFFVCCFAIDYDYRNKGVGVSLFAEIEKVAKKLGFKELNLFTHEKANAYNFWENRGFKRTNLVYMKKKLNS